MVKEGRSFLILILSEDTKRVCLINAVFIYELTFDDEF